MLLLDLIRANPRAFSILIIILMVLAGIAYALAGEIKTSLYWFVAAVLNTVIAW